ncbi:MAG: hypothetical protein V7776_23095 [Halopseudomonas aestusnigri]
MLTEATYKDIDRILEYFYKFAQNISFDEEIETPALRETLVRMIEDPKSTIFLTTCGMLGASIVPKYYNSKDILAVEMFMYAEDGKGLTLIKAFEDWAKENGANSTVLGSVPTKRSHILEKLYQRRGYEKREVAYARPVLR